jgi:hypothetical protein
MMSRESRTNITASAIKMFTIKVRFDRVRPFKVFACSNDVACGAGGGGKSAITVDVLSVAVVDLLSVDVVFGFTVVVVTLVALGTPVVVESEVVDAVSVVLT